MTEYTHHHRGQILIQEAIIKTSNSVIMLLIQTQEASPKMGLLKAATSLQKGNSY